MEEAVLAEASVEGKEVAQVLLVVECRFTYGIELPSPFRAEEEKVADGAVVEVDALQADCRVFFKLFFVFSLHLRGIAVKGCEVFAGKEAELKFGVELVEEFGGVVCLLHAQGLSRAFASQRATVKVGKEEVVEDAINPRIVFLFEGQFLSVIFLVGKYFAGVFQLLIIPLGQGTLRRCTASA